RSTSAHAASGAGNGRVQYRWRAHSCLEPSPRRPARLLQKDGGLCVGGEVSEGGDERKGPRRIVDAHSARCDECAERAASEGEPRLTECLHGEREDECSDAGGPVTTRLKVVRHDGTLVLRSLHVEFGEWRECE